MTDLLTTDIWNGRTLGDLLTLEFLVSAFGSLVSALLILLAGLFVAGWLRRRITGVSRRYHRLDPTLFGFLGNVVWYVVFAFAILFVLNTFGVQTTSIVALVGAAGLAIGLALQGTLSNVAAGVMIIFFRPIKQGDFVEINGRMGTVKDVSLNYTELADLSNVQIIVPNAEVWGNTIVNYSVYPTRRAEWTFGVAYDADLDLAEQVIRDTILTDPRAHADPAPFVQVNNLGEFSVDFLVRVWCASGDLFAFQTDMKRRVKVALDEAGIEIPFPTRTMVQAKGRAAE